MATSQDRDKAVKEQVVVPISARQPHIYPTLVTWQDRLKAVIGPRGYDDCMRRSLQTILLYESKRAVEPRYKTMRPYQRKAAFMDQCYFLLNALHQDDFLTDRQRDEVLWRTMTSRVPLDGGVAWTRLKCIAKELASLEELIKPFLTPGRTHNQAVDMLVQSLYEGKEGAKTGKTAPWTYEYGHNHCITAFRLYYNGDTLADDFPVPTLCPQMRAPQTNEMPKRVHHRPAIAVRPVTSHDHHGPPPPAMVHHHHPQHHVHHDPDDSNLDVAAIILGESSEPADDRRQMLVEVRQHLDLLKEFEGVISKEDIAQRKRDLFRSLPPAPTPSKKPKVVGNARHLQQQHV